MSSPTITGQYSLTITGTKQDVKKFLTLLYDEEYQGGLCRSHYTTTGYHSRGCGNIEIYRKSLEKAYSKHASSDDEITYTLLWYDQDNKHCGFDYHNGISLTHYDTSTEGNYEEHSKLTEALPSSLKGKLSEFMRDQKIPEQDDVPLERAGACGLPRVPAPAEAAELAPNPVTIRGMDEANQKAMNVWATQGESAMLKHIMTREDGTPMSYAESRMMYG